MDKAEEGYYDAITPKEQQNYSDRIDDLSSRVS